MAAKKGAKTSSTTPSKKKKTVSKTTNKKEPSSRKTAASKKAPVSKKTAKKSASASKAASGTARSATAKKSATKKTASKKAVTGKTPAKKAAAKKTSVSGKTDTRRTTSGKSSSKKRKSVVSSVSAAAQRIEKKSVARKKKAVAAKAKSAAKPLKRRKITKSALGKRDLKMFRELLLELRERIQGDIKFLTTDNLHRMGRETGADLSGASQHSADHGTDNFDREFALSLASSEQDVLYEVDEAIQRIDEGVYGICEYSGYPIEKARLEVIPYTRFSVEAQAMIERKNARYSPFGQTFKGW